jgi:CheY-like chemotaxis protein
VTTEDPETSASVNVGAITYRGATLKFPRPVLCVTSSRFFHFEPYRAEVVLKSLERRETGRTAELQQMAWTEGRRKATILVVEDSEDTREALVVLLEMEGYQAIPAGNGREALDYLNGAPSPALIILDLWMPLMNGAEFRREQMKDARLAAIPVIIRTASSSSRPIDVAANEVVVKPFHIEKLLAIVSHYCKLI